MRINYYRFPENTPVDVLAQHGCTLWFGPGVEITFRDGTKYTTTEKIDFTPHEGNNYGADEIEKYRDLFLYAEDTIGGLTVTTVKNLMKEYGGCGWTCHCDRSGGCFEVTDIKLSGNNSKFKYNVHL